MIYEPVEWNDNLHETDETTEKSTNMEPEKEKKQDLKEGNVNNTEEGNTKIIKNLLSKPGGIERGLELCG